MDEKKRKHIIDTAMKLFNETGFHNTPTSKIAKKAKISVGTLFNYFPTKEELIEAIYNDIKSHSAFEFLGHLEENLTDHNLLKSMWLSIILWGVDFPEEFHFLGLYNHSPYRKLHQNEKLLEEFTRLRETLINSVNPTTICQQYPEFAVEYLNSAIRATTDFLLKNEVEDTTHFILASFDLFWKGFSIRYLPKSAE